MIMAQRATDDATTNARVRRADQRCSVDAGPESGAEIGKGDTVTGGSFGVCRTATCNAALRLTWGSTLFMARQTANAKHLKWS